MEKSVSGANTRTDHTTNYGPQCRTSQDCYPQLKHALKHSDVAAWIEAVDGVVAAIGVFVQGNGIGAEAFKGIHRPEPAALRIVIACAQVIEIQVRIVLLGREQIAIGSGACASN